MSNYLVVVTSVDLRSRVVEWLAASGCPPREHLHVALDATRDLLLVSPRVRDGLLPAVPDRASRVTGRMPTVPTGEFFRGTAMVPEHAAIAFGAQGWSALPDAVRRDPHGVSGEFVLVSWDTATVRVRRDVLGSVPLARTQGPGFAAVGDSLLVLADLRAWLASPVTPDERSLLSRTSTLSICHQQLGERTHVREVAYVAAARGVGVDVASLTTRVDGPSLVDRVVDVELDDVAALRAAATFVVRAMGTLAARDDWDVRLLLSGGYDSRLLLAGAVRFGTHRTLVVETTDHGPSSAGDVAVVRDLAARYRLLLNVPRRLHGERRWLDSPLAVVASGTLGFYDTVAERRTARRGDVGITGLGAGVYKGAWGWVPVRSMRTVRAVPKDVRDLVADELADGVRATGGDPGWADASELSYAGFRNGLHGGAGGLLTGMTSLRPLNEVGLAAVGHRRTDGRPALRRRHRARLRGAVEQPMADLLALVDPELAVLPYDSPERALPPATVARRLEALGGPLGREAEREIELLGVPADVPYGPTRLGLGIAERRGFGGLIEAEHLLALADDGVEALTDRTVRDAYARLLRDARVALVDEGRHPRDAGAATGKLLAATMLGTFPVG
ncbi:hypothetical protein [Cellulomonas composti]|uniref:Asparagine synthetase domain-containing protein n=1 Tax=Cellulomonas composti TaxID=266130 RepID=A0A511JB35_9CELL|nr:hypothetical protein [Cellulomonas composti]GEL95188.1 hypothetical protein CCO02nite_18460 [Cellulomonas composti]